MVLIGLFDVWREGGVPFLRVRREVSRLLECLYICLADLLGALGRSRPLRVPIIIMMICDGENK